MQTRPSRSPVRRPLESGQALIVIAATFVALAAFIGLAIDFGILITSQAHLRRAVDSASLAAATQIRENQSPARIQAFAQQFVDMNGLDRTTMVFETCATTPGDPVLCTNPPRKLVRVRATMLVRFAFLPIIGLFETPISADAISEAASIDVVLVLGTNITMGRDTPGYGGAFDPTACNANAGPQAAKYPNTGDSPQKCRPLWDAKQAAKVVLDRLYRGADRVGIVTYDFGGRVIYPLTVLSSDQDAVDGVSDSTGAYAAVDNIQLYQLAPYPDKPGGGKYQIGQFSPLNIFCTIANPSSPDCDGLNGRNPSGVAPNTLCVGCGMRVAGDLLKASGRPESVWVMIFLSDGVANMSDTPTSLAERSAVDAAIPNVAGQRNAFCAGGVVAGGSINSAWGLWNAPTCRNGGFGDGIGNITYTINVPGTGLVERSVPKAQVANPFLRMCGPYVTSAAECPPGALFVGTSGVTTTIPATRTIVADGALQVISTTVVTHNAGNQPALYYSAEDYARDMIDQAAMTVRCNASSSAAGLCNPTEQGTRLAGANISVYAIGLGSGVIAPPEYSGVRLLRYMASVADDGDRASANDPCYTAPGVPVPFDQTNCGNYYFASNPGALVPIFEDIAKRIFTRISR